MGRQAAALVPAGCGYQEAGPGPAGSLTGTSEDYGATQKVPPGAGPWGREGQLRPSVMPALAPMLPDKEASSAGLAGHRAMPPGLFLNLASGQGYAGSQAQSQGCSSL